MKERIKSTLEDYERVVKHLESAVKKAADELEIDGTIKRFELCYELSWKLIKVYLEDFGIICKNPRESFKAAVLNDLIDNENVWMDMLEDRNRLVHTYNLEESREIFDNIKEKYINSFTYLLKTIKGREDV